MDRDAATCASASPATIAAGGRHRPAAGSTPRSHAGTGRERDRRRGSPAPACAFSRAERNVTQGSLRDIYCAPPADRPPRVRPGVHRMRPPPIRKAVPMISAGTTDVRRRNNVREYRKPRRAPDRASPHGFGCSQEAWRLVAPRFADDYRVILFDLVGSGGSDLAAYDRSKYDSLHGYADDLLEVMDVARSARCRLRRALGEFDDRRARRQRGLVPVRRARAGRPVARYVNDGAYVGGFERPTSTGCSTRSTATTSAGRRRWRR